MTWAMQWVAKPTVTLPPYLFSGQRERCAQCSNCMSKLSQGEVRVMQCKLACTTKSANGQNWEPCSSARLPGGLCGPDASRFERA